MSSSLQHSMIYMALAYDIFRPLGKGNSPIAKEKVVEELADKYSVTPNQIILAWGVHRGTSVVPKSSNKDRQRQNITLPRLTNEEIERVTRIHTEDKTKHKSLFFEGTMSKMGGKILGIMPIEEVSLVFIMNLGVYSMSSLNSLNGIPNCISDISSRVHCRN